MSWPTLVDLLKDQGAIVHLAHPSGLRWERRRVKNDEINAIDLAGRLCIHRLPEAWIAPSEVSQLRELSMGCPRPSAGEKDGLLD